MDIRSLLKRRARAGFTLIELLLVIGIIAILASIVIVAINPNRQLGQSRDAQRRSDVNTLLNAIYQYSIDNNGQLPGVLSGAGLATGTNCTNSTGCFICMDTACRANTSTIGPKAALARFLTGSYVVAMPQDPRLRGLSTASGGITGYKVFKDTTGRITVWAPYAEQETGGNKDTAMIKVTR